MFVRKLYRLHGLTWSRWKGVIKQGNCVQTCLQRKADITSSAFSLRMRITSNTFCSSNNFNSEAGSSQTDLENSPDKELTEKGIGKFQDDQEFKMVLKPDQPKNAKILRVAIIGLPNSGKSTLTNSLMGWRVSSVSKKVHTTRKNTIGIYTQDDTQIVFLDTPGILSPSSRKKHNLEKSLLIDPERSLHQADLVCVLLDVSNKWTRNELDPLILQTLYLHRHTPAILILNKVDLLHSKEMLLHMTRILTQGMVNNQPVGFTTKKTRKPDKELDLEQLFSAMEAHKADTDSQQRTDDKAASSQTDMEPCGSDFLEQQTSSSSSDTDSDDWNLYFEKMRQASRAVLGMKAWPLFQQVFMVSATSGDGVADVRNYMMDSAKPGDWDYHSSLVTLQDPKEVVLMCVKEKFLEHLVQEQPYKMDLDIVLWEVDEDGMFNIIININTANRRHMSFLLGPKGQTIQKIASEAKQEMMNTFRCDMRLKLVARVKPAHRG